MGEAQSFFAVRWVIYFISFLNKIVKFIFLWWLLGTAFKLCLLLQSLSSTCFACNTVANASLSDSFNGIKTYLKGSFLNKSWMTRFNLELCRNPVAPASRGSRAVLTWTYLIYTTQVHVRSISCSMSKSERHVVLYWRFRARPSSTHRVILF